MQHTHILSQSRYCLFNLRTAERNADRPETFIEICLPLNNSRGLLYQGRNEVYTQTAPLQTVPLRVRYVLTHVLYVFAQGLKPDTALLRKVPESPSWSHNSLPPPRLHRECCHWLANSRGCRHPWEFPAGHRDAPRLISEGRLCLLPDFPAQPSLPQKPVYVVVGCCSP